MDTETPSLKAILEGLLLIAGEEGLSLIQLRHLYPDTDAKILESALEELAKDYEARDGGIELVHYASRWKLVSRDFVFEQAQKLYQDIKAPSLSSAALETLAIVAYRQPVTRIEIEELRGVSCEAMLKKLQQRGLIEATKRAETIGNPLLYEVTEEFMNTFALESLDHLPALQSTQVQKELFQQDSEV